VTTQRDVITGAFSYTGRHVAQILAQRGRRVATLTNHSPHGVSRDIEIHPLRFDDPESLKRALDGADTLYNSYWVRFAHGDESFARAIANTETLVAAAVRAGVRRIVHVSIANVEDGAGLPYFDGKAACEETVRSSGLSYAIVRPTVLFGGRDVFVSNIAWLLRRFPVFPVAGDGAYGIQAVHVEDHARLMVEAGLRDGGETFDTAGPEAFTFEDFVRLIARGIGRPARIVHVPPAGLIAASRLIGWWLHDVVLNREELDGLMRGLMISKERPMGTTRFTRWLADAANDLGRDYANEIARHYT
jgi:uncharacterized protein YbjT (DUF2867 family)